MPYLLAQICHSRSVIEGRAIQGTEQDNLNKFYGKSLFRCPVLQCPYFVTGFGNRKERERHCNNHQRSFMCPHETCDYSVLGLPSDSALKTHLSLCHEDLTQTPVFPDIKTRTLEQALEDAIAGNNLLAITALATELASFPGRNRGFVLQALTLGYREAVLTLLDLLGSPSELDHVHKKSAAILKVCEIGDEELFDIMVEKGVNININTSLSENALSVASQNCHLSIVRKLLDNKRYNRYWSHASNSRKGALAMASTYGHAEIVSLLLEKDSNHFVQKKSKDFNEALNAAIKEKRVSCAKLLLNWALEKDPSILPTKLCKILGENIDHMIEILSAEQAKIIEEDGGTKGNALQAKARKGDCEAVSHLLDLGADIDNLKGDYGTPMMAAASNGKLEMIHLLIERGADVKKKDDSKRRFGRSAIDVAAANCHETVVRALLDKGAVFTHESILTIDHGRYTPLQALSRRADSAALTRLLLENGANVDYATGAAHYQVGSWTPLQLAAKYGGDATLQVLLEYGADVNNRGSHEFTPLYLATQRTDHSLASILRLLSVKGIEINAKSDYLDGYTALHMAVKLGKSDILKILLDHGADINAINTKGETALIVGATCSPWEKYQQVIHILVERGANIETVDEDGNTAIMVAAKHWNKSLEVIQFLVERGAESSTRNLKGLTALMIAADRGNLPAVECLLQRRTSQYIEENGEVWSAVESATRTCHVKIARVLLEFLSKTVVRDHQYLLSAARSFEYSKEVTNPDMISLLAEYGASVVPPAHESNLLHEFWVDKAGGVEGYQDDQELFYADQDFQADGSSQVGDDFRAGNFQVDGDSQTHDSFQGRQLPGRWRLSDT